MFEGLGNTTIKEAMSNSDDEGSDKAGNDGAPFRKNSRSPPRVKKNTQVCQSQAFAMISKGPTNMANKDQNAGPNALVNKNSEANRNVIEIAIQAQNKT